jgi:hypothetical protein
MRMVVRISKPVSTPMALQRRQLCSKAGAILFRAIAAT